MKAQKLDWNTKNFSSPTGFHRRRRWYFQMFGNLFQIEKVKVALCTRVIVWRYIIQDKCWKHTLAVWGTIGESIYRFQLNRFNFSFFPFICCCSCTKFYSAFNTIFYVHYELAEAAKKAHKFQSFSLSFLSFFHLHVFRLEAEYLMDDDVNHSFLHLHHPLSSSSLPSSNTHKCMGEIIKRENYKDREGIIIFLYNEMSISGRYVCVYKSNKMHDLRSLSKRAVLSPL